MNNIIEKKVDEIRNSYKEIELYAKRVQMAEVLAALGGNVYVASTLSGLLDELKKEFAKAQISW